METNRGKVIMGVDPGSVVMGFAVIQCEGPKIQLLHLDALRMSWTHDVYERLQRIYETTDALIAQHNPDTFAIEAPFYGKNVQSMLKLGRAQGVAIACAMQHSLLVAEYSPKKVKQAITGNGNAGKEQVWAMLQRMTGFSEKPAGYDVSDALAVAVCHYYQAFSPVGRLSMGKPNKGWEEFIRKNPGRLR